ncbi:sensor domain-containing protein [Pseudoxanthomonas dokdonensis]|uniref:Membrane protein n=1 Tax=Pseudoxanthomonas dokdonensis TaxID=344882 RepID=A0A0R0CF51_9GAMM|nr:sensor domain-containing protein [Pseudoxanthomonas dokdonensis]KRG67904.1 membrane protein [Pseudoxanthomonas dokdonensis]
MNSTVLPTTIPQYLDQLRLALKDADPAMIQDALYDAEEYLRSELAEQSGRSEAEVIASVAGSYGAPEEVADIYRQTEVTVNRALRPPMPAKRKSWLGRFFGVAADPHTYGALFYLMLSLATGIFYFTWVVTGMSLSVSLLILIIGIPLLLLFLASVRLMSLVEGRIVEVLLGERMPRRPLYTQRDKPWLTRIKEMFTDGRTWTAMLYMLLMMPLGTFYFSVLLTLLTTSIVLIGAPVMELFGGQFSGVWLDGVDIYAEWAWVAPLMLLAGVLLLFVTLHVARGLGKLHAQLAKHLLVRSALV